jgi:hypothetical protein
VKRQVVAFCSKRCKNIFYARDACECGKLKMKVAKTCRACRRKFSDSCAVRAAALYRAGYTCLEIASEIGCCQMTARKLAIHGGAVMRKPGKKGGR